MEIIKTPFDGILLVKPDVFADERGYFFESFNYQKFLRVIKHDSSLTQHYTMSFLPVWLFLIIYHHLFYYATLIFFIYGLFRFRKEIIKNSYLIMFLVYAAAGIAMTMAADADVRFKFPYMFVIFICNAFFMAEFLKFKLTTEATSFGQH